ncbi:MAG: fibronectin type III domain-containing protein [Caldilineaceae bacterium]|nr:fibronectin type III domain-containing protein [Caldilineaceae bacterium]
MKQTTRLLALSALVLALMLGVFGAPALEAPSVAFAQGQVPAAPQNLTAQRSGASTINLSWDQVNGAVRYQVYYYVDTLADWARLDGGAVSPHTATTYSHQGLVADKHYFYYVYAVNSQGERGAISNRADAVAGQNAPARPVLSPAPGYLLNVISWPQVSGATSYRLYAWDQTWSQIGGTLTDTTFTHTGLTAGKTYYYQAQAVNAGGLGSAYSLQVSATVLSSPTITAPVNLQASLDDQQTTLTWQAPPGAGGTITGYEYRYAESTATLPATWSDAGNDLTETITGLTNGTQYTFEVRAVSSTGMGPPARVMATPAAVPDAPVLTATEGYRQVMLSWEAPDNNGAAITAYRIQILNAQNQWVAEGSVPGTTTTYTDGGLRDSTVYTYRVIAVNAAGDSSASNSADATTLAQPAQAPGPPTTIGAAPGPGKITLSWRAPLFNGGSPITRYEYRYAEAALSTTTPISWSGWMSAMTELMVEIMPLKPDTVYSFEVRAVNSAGAGNAANSDGLDGTTLRTPGDTGPTAVPSLRTSLGTHDGTNADEGHESNAQITVTWNALPASANGGSAITGYELCYKKSTDSAWMRWDATADGFGAPTPTGSVYNAVHGDDTSDDTLLDPGTIYQYRARAYNAVAGVGPSDAATCTHWDGDWSSVVSAAMTPVVKPSAPTLHPATSDPPAPTNWALNVNSITIRWAKPSADGGRAISSYEVWMGTATVTDAAEIAALKPTVINLPASRLEYISIGLRAETPYFYRVRARNGSGDKYVGAWSEEVSGTTTATQTGTPEAPTLATVTAEADGDVPLSWTPPTNRGTSPITSYEVQYQRTDDGGGDQGAEDATDLGDWSDAATATTTGLTWTHMQAPGLSTYAYRVRAVNSSGAGAWSTVAGGVTVAARVPSKPTLTAAELGMDEIMLRWNIPENNGTAINGFEIQQWDSTTDPANPAWGSNNLLTVAGGADEDMSDDATLTVFAVTGLDSGTKYYFRIRATTAGDPGVWSAENMADAASATTEAGLPVQPVITVVAGTDDDADSITITWTAPGSGGSELLGYQLRVAEWAGSGWAALEDGSPWVLEANLAADATMYKDEGLKPGTRYYYILAARNSMGYGAWSAEKSVMTASNDPDAPTLSATATSGTSIQLTWNVPNANGATITGYELVKADTTADPAVWGTTNLLAADSTVTEFVDTGLSPGTEHIYRIRALPQSGTGGWSATDVSDGASATTHGDAPGRPTALAVAPASTTSLTLTWTAPTETGGSDITGFEVQIRSGGRWVDEATPTTATYTDTGLAVGTKYYYRVRAVNSQGGGLWSAYASGTTTAANPDAPVLMAAAASMTTIRLTWTVPNDNGVTGGITGYELQRFGASGWDSTNLLGTDAAATIGLTLFVDSGLDPGKTYHYRIRATPQTGDNDGWSASDSATTVAGAPDRPTMVTATADGQNAVDLTWQAPANNGSAIVRYVLERYTTETRWVVVRHDLPSTRTSYKDTNLDADTRYVYRIRAVNRAEHNNGMGKYSTIVFVTTAK